MSAKADARRFRASLFVCVLSTACTAPEPEDSDEEPVFQCATDTGSPRNLQVVSRSGDTLGLEWEGGDLPEGTWYSIDVLTDVPSCADFPSHSGTVETDATSYLLTGLSPDTVYHVHVHGLSGQGGTLLEGKSDTVYVSTLSAGAPSEAVAPDEYECC